MGTKKEVAAFAAVLRADLSLQSPESKARTGVYLIYCIMDGKGYIGSAWQIFGIRGRWDDHVNDAKRNDHGNIHFQNAWNKYGPDSFEFLVIETCENQFCIPLEQSYIDMYWDTGLLFNISKTAIGWSGPHSDESKAKMSDSQKKRYEDPSVRQLHSEMTKLRQSDPVYRKNMSDTQVARCAAPEVRVLLDAAAKARWADPQSYSRQSESMTSTWKNPDYKASTVAAMKKAWENPDTKEKQSSAQKSRWEDPVQFEKGMENIKAMQIVRWADPEAKKNQSDYAKLRYTDPEEREKASEKAVERWSDPDQRKRQSIALKAAWARRKLLKSQLPPST